MTITEQNIIVVSCCRCNSLFTRIYLTTNYEDSHFINLFGSLLTLLFDTKNRLCIKFPWAIIAVLVNFRVATDV